MLIYVTLKKSCNKAGKSIRYFVVDLHRISNQITDMFVHEKWQVERFLGDHLLSIHRNGVKLHLGHIEIEQDIIWKHNGDRDILIERKISLDSLRSQVKILEDS